MWLLRVRDDGGKNIMLNQSKFIARGLLSQDSSFILQMAELKRTLVGLLG